MQTTETTHEKKRSKVKMASNYVRDIGLVIFIALFALVIQLRNNTFLTPENLGDMLANAAILGILSMGMLMVMLTGGIDLSIGSNMALTGMIAAILIRDNPTINPIIPIIVAMVIGLVSGAIIGFLVSILKVLPIIASLGMNFVFRGLAYIVSGRTWVSAHQLSESFKEIGTGKFLGLSYLVWIALVIFLISQYFLSSTRTGRSIYAVGSNPKAVKISGINPQKVEILVYSIMGLFAGLAGALWVAKFASAQPDTAVGYETNVIAACVIGGVSVNGGSGKVLGVFLGTLLIGILNNALPLLLISPFWQSFIQGCIILIAVVMNCVFERRRNYQQLLRREI